MLQQERMRCVRETSAGFTQSLWHLQHSLEMPGEQWEVCICIAACTAGTHVDGQSTCRVLQVRRKTQRWSWLPLLDSEHLWENNISCFNLTRTSVSKASQAAGVQIQLDSTLILLCKVLFSVRGPYNCSWKPLTAFAEKCPNIAQTISKNNHVWICPCIILLLFFTANSEAVMTSKRMFEFTSSLRNEMSGFQLQSESLKPPENRWSFVLWLHCLLILCNV